MRAFLSSSGSRTFLRFLPVRSTMSLMEPFSGCSSKLLNQAISSFVVECSHFPDPFNLPYLVLLSILWSKMSKVDSKTIAELASKCAMNGLIAQIMHTPPIRPNICFTIYAKRVLTIGHHWYRSLHGVGGFTRGRSSFSCSETNCARYV